MIIMLAGLSYLYLVVCFYVVHRTGSTEGLADIGNATLLSVTAAALAVAAGLRK
jgi:hypothetical protein